MIKYRLKLSYSVAPTKSYPLGIYVDVSPHDTMACALAYAARRDREFRPCAEQPSSFFSVEIYEVEI